MGKTWKNRDVVSKGASKYVNLAVESINNFIKYGKVIKKEDYPEYMDIWGERAGAFVSIKKNRALRGCIGTISPTRKSVADEIINNAISAATQDPRFKPVSEDELAELSISVDILEEPESIEGENELDPRTYGVIVESRGKRGLLLPDLEGVESAEQQIDIAMQKAHIKTRDGLKLYRFRVRRYH